MTRSWKKLGFAYFAAIALMVFTVLRQLPVQSNLRPEQVLSSTSTPVTNVEQPVSTTTTTPKPSPATPKPTPVVAPKQSSYVQSLATLKALGDKYGISIGIDAPSSGTLGTAGWHAVNETDQNNLITFTKYMTEEWQKYPVDFITRTGLKHIYVVKDLQVGGQYRAAMPDPVFGDAVYYDLSAQYSNSKYMRNVIHHEFDHLIEYNIYGSYAWNDTNWKACNTTGFTYGNGGWTAYADPTYANTPHPQAGFVTGYGTYGIEEDKAEIYAELMTNPGNISNLIALDSNLACKVSLYRSDMAALGLNL